jgi:hypothetical protein
MMNLIAALFLFLMMDLVPAPATIPSAQGSSVVTYKNGTPGWTANWTMEPARYEGRKAVRFTERGQGHLSQFPGQVQWTLESTWLAESSFQPMEFEKTIRSSSGQVLVTERKHFDPKQHVVRFERRYPGGKSEVESLNAPADTVAVEGIAGALRFLPFDRQKSFPLHMMSNEPKIYSVTLENRGKERVKTPAGEFECYKLEVVPHVGVLNVFRSFFPKAYFWFAVAPPHFWVKYEGPQDGPGTPDIIMQLGAAAAN